MAAKGELAVRVVSPEALVYEGTCSAVSLPAWDGRMGIRPGHAPFLGLLGSGMVELTPVSGATEELFLAGGTVKVEGDRVTILSEFASREVPAGKPRTSGVLDLDLEPADLEAMSYPGNPLA